MPLQKRKQRKERAENERRTIMLDRGYDDGLAAYKRDAANRRVATENSQVTKRALESVNKLNISDQRQANEYVMGFIMGYTSQSS